MAGNKPLPEREPELRHETRDVDVWAIGRFGMGLALLCILSLAGLLGLFHYFESRYGGRVAITLPPGPESGPRLEVTPVLDLARERAAEDKILNSYGWVDQKAGIARIPIDKAMDFVVERGLPWQAPGTGPAPTAPNPNPATGPMPGASREQEDLSKTNK